MQKQNLGIVVNDLRPSTRNYKIIELGNKISKENNDIDFYVFVNNIEVPPRTILFPVLQQRNMWGFNGTLISTDINTTHKILNIPNTCNKYFYVWNMNEWLSLKDIDEVYFIYKNDKLMLIARSDEYGTILSRNFNTIPLLIKDFNYDSMCKLCKIRQNPKG